jgi:alcohol dehydrogenase (cytochrome c)
MSQYRTGSIFTLAIAFLALNLSAQTQGPSQRELNNAVNDKANWLYVDHDYQGTRYSALDQINTANVGQLAKACAYTFPEKSPSQTAPIVYEGTIYVTSAHYTVALDGANCNVLWQHKWEPRLREVFKTQRGVALKNGRIVRGTTDGYLIALNAKTGKELWNRLVADPADGYFVSAPPLIVDDLIFIGPAGSESAVKGWVGAFKLSNGERVWKFNTVPDLGEPGTETWGNNPKGLKTGGGAIWTAMSFDPDKQLLYVPVGNPAPDFYDKNRPGANLYTSSVVALQIATGKLAWYYQATPHDQRDYDLTHASPVFSIVSSGVSRKVMSVTGKDGLLRLLDLDTREVIYSVPFTTRKNSEGPVGLDPIHICPGILGGHEWSGSAYSPVTSTLFVPATDWCSDVRMVDKEPEPQDDNTKGPYFFGGESKFLPWSEASGWLTAFDVVTGKERWKYHASKPMIGGVVATAGGLVFTGELGGAFEAFDAQTGKVLFTRAVGGPVGGGVVSYAVRGKQHVAVVSGYIGSFNDFSPELGGANPTITVFALK